MTSSPLPTVQYLVAFNNGPNDDPALITSVATPAGTLGAHNVWTDITDFVLEHQMDRGRQHELDQFEAGTLQLTVGNSDARFNPWNASGPYAGLLTIGKLVQYRATWGGTTYTRFTGHIDAVPTLWPDPVSARAQIHVTDAFRLFNKATIIPAYLDRIIADGATDIWMMGDLAGASLLANDLGGDPLVPTAPSVALPTCGVTGGIACDPATATAFPAMQANTAGIVGSLSGDWSIEVLESIPALTLAAQGGFSFEDASGACVTVQFGPDTVNGAAVDCSCVYQKGSTTITVGVAGVTDGTFHHLAFTFDGTFLTAYLDGVSVGSSATNEGGTIPTPYGSDGGTVGAFDATMTLQGLALYAGLTLTSAQIATHYELTQWGQMSTDARIGQVLDAIGWSTGARDLDAGNSQVQEVTSSLATIKALTHLQDCECTEGGALYMNGSGQVRFISRSGLLSDSTLRTVQATFGDEPSLGQIPYQPGIQPSVDDIQVFNEATGQRQGGQQITASNRASQLAYGSQTWQPAANLIGTSDEEVQNRLEYVVSILSTPTERISTIAIQLIDLIEPNLVAPVLLLGLLYMVEVKRAGIQGGGTALDIIGQIEKMSEHVSADDWTLTLQLDIVDQTQYFKWGTSEWGVSTEWPY